MALMAIVELANVVHRDTYTAHGVSPAERMSMIHARKQGREVMAYLCAHYQLVGGVYSKLSDLFLEYLCRQAEALKNCKEHADERDITPYTARFTLAALTRELDLCLADRPRYVETHENYISSQPILAFGWSGPQYTVFPRPLPEAIDGTYVSLSIKRAAKFSTTLLGGIEGSTQSDKLWKVAASEAKG
jgi:hypothetical protein